MTAETFNPDTDLMLSRRVDVPREAIWRAWTTPSLVTQWFTPAPWRTLACEIDLRPGGLFRTVMQSPEGEEFPNAGCILDVVAGRRLVFTDALGEGFRPNAESFFTAIIELEDDGDGTLYTAYALHKDAAGRQAHEEMGFTEGWGKALDQLVALVKSLD
ncbi:hypothetical protein S7S_03880 [Isoalcanivorax pacificus W11-5]|uniref:Activator of Hsp90 ATPase homologue 1/2-like C-terminal domain-containing protein n=1 Tax=Isoalcanivorax pacificus W11-5 TaxID=391936 RepID=A0A0B4XKT9_9GAMM|nr:SRPBCC family protein [Isoalcanivorax pacificus]AJD47198.1 hypothetical protein S7S_03880 [Isoalcanivorax pacificus W11-5]